jgi:hypothetical protein
MTFALKIAGGTFYLVYLVLLLLFELTLYHFTER